MGIFKVKKFVYSILCAFLMLIYVPLACAVGGSVSDEVDYANADTPETCEECTEDSGICEICIHS